MGRSIVNLLARTSRRLIVGVVVVLALAALGASYGLLRGRPRYPSFKECNCIVSDGSYGRLGANGACQPTACGINPNSPILEASPTQGDRSHR